jgi:hypothetical protein
MNYECRLGIAADVSVFVRQRDEIIGSIFVIVRSKAVKSISRCNVFYYKAVILCGELAVKDVTTG